MKIEKNISLKKYTTIRIGGNAKVIYFPENTNDLKKLENIFIKNDTLIIGNGSADVNGSTIFLDNILGSVKNLGCDLHLINFTTIMTQIREENISDTTLRNNIGDRIFNDVKVANDKKPFDLVLSFLDANIVSPDFFIEL